MTRVSICLAGLIVPFLLQAQAPVRPDAGPAVIIRPGRVFDGSVAHEGWAVRVRGERIEAVGPAATIVADGAGAIDPRPSPRTSWS